MRIARLKGRRKKNKKNKPVKAWHRVDMRYAPRRCHTQMHTVWRIWTSFILWTRWYVPWSSNELSHRSGREAPIPPVRSLPTERCWNIDMILPRYMTGFASFFLLPCLAFASCEMLCVTVVPTFYRRFHSTVTVSSLLAICLSTADTCFRVTLV